MLKQRILLFSVLYFESRRRVTEDNISIRTFLKIKWDPIWIPGDPFWGHDPKIEKHYLKPLKKMKGAETNEKLK